MAEEHIETDTTAVVTNVAPSVVDADAGLGSMAEMVPTFTRGT